VRTAGQPAKQGYNAQAAVNERQIVIAAEITVDSPDFGHLEPMVNATVRELEDVGVSESPEVVLADAGYWHKRQMEHVVNRGIQVLIPPDSGLRKGTRPGWDKGLYAFMRRVLETDHGEGALSKTPGDGGASVRPHQVQPSDRPLPTTRQIRRALGMAISSGDTQPAEAPQPPNSRRWGLKQPPRCSIRRRHR
jgi:hypothetical protein